MCTWYDIDRQQESSAIMDTATKEYASIVSKQLDDMEARLNINNEALRSSQSRLYDRCGHQHDQEAHWSRTVFHVIEKLVHAVRNRSHSTNDTLQTIQSLVEKQNEKLLDLLKMDQTPVAGHQSRTQDMKLSANPETIDDDEEKLLDYSYSDTDDSTNIK